MAGNLSALRSAVLLLAVSVFLGAPASSAEYHVSPSGSRLRNGSLKNPWDLQTALSGEGANPRQRVRPGDTVWLHGGVYRGGFVSKLSGSAKAPITVRQAIGERATID